MALLAADLESAKGLAVAGRWWILPAVVATAGLALVAPRWPVRAGVGVGVVLVVWSALMRLIGAEVLPVLGPLLATEVAALMAVIVVVVRRADPGTAAAVAGLLLAGCVAAQLLRPRFPSDHESSLLWDLLLPTAVLLGLSVGAGRYLRARDREQEGAMRAAVASAQQRERVSLARELHDVVAHHVGVMVVQAQAAQTVAGTDPGAAARVLPMIEGAGADALAAMRRLVAALRYPEGDGGEGIAAPIQTTDLGADLRTVTAGGRTPVRLTVELAEPVPPEVATSVLRLVQESVTNAWRHAAGAAEIVVSVTTGDGTVRVRVDDDGAAAGASPGRPGGYGLVGMRERVALLGGWFTAGPAPGGGWQVAADVPLRESGR